MIDIFNIKPTTISRDLSGVLALIYGVPKVGKTTFVSSFKKSLYLATEPGYREISGLNVVDITRWSDIKTVLRQLRNPEAKEMYDTVIFDTVGLAYEMAEKFICGNNRVTAINEIPWGQLASLY